MIPYRADIDGLRALAVTLVVLFHAGLPGISGGFIGVDIFFVISGYLITSIILSDVRKGNFSYLTFYERRARRILPAFYFVASVSLIAAVVMFTPNDLIKTSKSLLAALAFSGNFFFWRTTNYFSDDSDFEPFLHTWSLAVEEQYYFLFPLVLLIFAKHHRFLLILCLATTLLSLALSEFATRHYTWAGYYLLPSRAWQLLAGALLAIYPVRLIQNNVIQNVLAILSLALIAIPAFFLNKNTPFPGLAALPPTLGACLLIYLGKNPTLFSTRLLSQRHVVFIGLISYSLYLWHWPVFAFIRYFKASVDLHIVTSFFGVIVSVGAAYLSWKFIENPFRNKKRFSRKSIFTYSILYGLLLGTACISVIALKGIPQRLDERVIRYSSMEGGYILADPCINKSVEQILDSDVCQYDTENAASNSKVLLWGDSHAAAFKPGFQKFLNEINSNGAFVGGVGCPPIPGVLKVDSATGQPCLKSNYAIHDYIQQDNQIKTVILHARWALSVDGSRFGVEKGPDYNLQDTESGPGSNYDHVYRSLGRLINDLNNRNIRVVLMGPIPEMGHNVPRLSANNIQWGKNREIRVTLDEFLKRQASVFDLLNRLKGQYSNVDVFLPHTSLCGNTYCEILENENLLYLDDDHLSTEGAIKVSDALSHWFLSENNRSTTGTN